MASRSSARFADILAVEEFIEGQEKKKTRKNKMNVTEEL